MNARHVLAAFAVLTGVLFAAPQALSRDRPGTAFDLKVTQASPNAVEFRFYNTATELVHFELDIEINGELVDPGKAHFLGDYIAGWGHDRGWKSGKITSDMVDNRLYPDTRFCMRVWTRTAGDVRSQAPTHWECVVLKPDRPPPEPDLDAVRFVSESARDRRLTAEFLIPPITPDVAIDHVIVETKDTRYPGWSHAFKKEYKVRNERRIHEKYERVEFPAPKLDATYTFRICLENQAGTVCSSQRPTLAIVHPKIKEQVETPQFEVAKKDEPRLNETQIEELARKPRQVEPKRKPPVPQTRSAGASRGSTPLQQAAQQSPASKATSPLSKATVEPKTSPTTSAPSSSGQSTPAATTTAGTVATQAPASGAAVVKQPGTALYSRTAPAQSRTASAAAAPSPASQQAAIPPELAAEAQGKELVEIRCRGGSLFSLSRISSDQVPAGSARFMMSFQLPPKNAAGNSPPAGEMGENLGPSQCSFADRDFSWDNPPGVMFDVPAAEANGDCPRVCQELRNPGTLWTFTTFKTNYGHFRAVAHERWQPTGTATNQR